MKISQIRAIHKACLRRDLAAMEEYLRASGGLADYHRSKYKTMRMYLRHTCGIECRNGKLYKNTAIARVILVWSTEAHEWQIGGLRTCLK